MNRILYACVCVFLIATSHSQAEDWLQYRGNAGDGSSSEQIADVDWAGSKPNVVWKVPAEYGFSSFSVADGRGITL